MKTRHVFLVPFLLLVLGTFEVSAFYDPGLQRWINRDPLYDRGSPSGRGSLAGQETLEGRNVFTFVENAPLGRLDPDGRNPIVIGGGVFAAYCVALIAYATFDAKRDLKPGECLNWSPRCLNLLSFMTGIGLPVSIQFCKGCDGKFSASLVTPIYIGPKGIHTSVPPGA
jgi:hypothetical protein